MAVTASNEGTMCECGCGQELSSTKVRFRAGHNMRVQPHPARAQQKPDKRGYTRATRNGIRRHIHRFIAEQVVGRVLPRSVRVHHVDENPMNNAHANLVVCENHSYHKLLHSRAAALRATGDPHKRRCAYCRKWGLPEEDLAAYQRRDTIPLFVHLKCSAARALKRYHASKLRSTSRRVTEYTNQERV